LSCETTSTDLKVVGAPSCSGLVGVAVEDVNAGEVATVSDSSLAILVCNCLRCCSTGFGVAGCEDHDDSFVVGVDDLFEGLVSGFIDEDTIRNQAVQC